MKIAILNDTHCGVRNASEIYLNNAEQFYNDVFFPKLEEEGIKHILHLGDYYDHRKFVNFKALTHSRKYFLNCKKIKQFYNVIGACVFNGFFKKEVSSYKQVV